MDSRISAFFLLFGTDSLFLSVSPPLSIFGKSELQKVLKAAANEAALTTGNEL